MTRVLLPLVLLGCSTAPAEPVGDAERSRFLLMAVLEELWTEGPDPGLLKPLLDAPRDHFVPKCPLCTPVAHAIRLYVENSDVPVYGARGKGFPAELADGLRSPDRAKRVKALEALVARSVARRFDRMTPGEQIEMRKYLEVGKQEGMALMEPEFGKACPSCS
ncbi:MAG: hypothetical protein HY293_08050, partial [Planctomycetes bacterium]|nr:hypothetical protein [Planctomycetota bacterium]